MIRPEVYCDINARMTERGFALTNGSLSDLARLGLTPSDAVGMAFTFNGGEDTDEAGALTEILFDGTIEWSSEWGFLAVSDERGVYWRPKR